MRSDWNILNEYREGTRKYLKVQCKKCGVIFERVRDDGLYKKACCSKKDRSQIIPEGTRFGILTVVGESHRDNGVHYKVACDCGNSKILSGSQLRLGTTKSCGCYKESLIGKPVENHGMSNTKEYKTWCSIINRTENPNESTRKWYFDKGIKMSEEWRNSFSKFYEDMGEAPEGFTIDRIDPAGDYCKENCRWASVELQSINKGISRNNTSGVTGVSFSKRTGSWVAYIYLNNKRFHLGTFSTMEDAVTARKQAEDQYWGHINE